MWKDIDQYNWQKVTSNAIPTSLRSRAAAILPFVKALRCISSLLLKELHVLDRKATLGSLVIIYCKSMRLQIKPQPFSVMFTQELTWIYGINASPRRIILAMHNLWLTVQVSKCYSFRGLFILNSLSKVQCFYHLKLVTDSKFRIKQRQETMILLTADPV